MDQVQNSILQMMQTVAAASQTASRNNTGRDEFRKLMEGQRKNDGGLQAEANPKAETPQDGECQEVAEDSELQAQMILAAAMLQNPVVLPAQEPVEAVEIQPQTETAPVEALPMVEIQEAPVETQETAPESLAEMELPKVSPDGAMQVRSSGEEAPRTQEVQTVQAEAPQDEVPVENVSSAQSGEESGTQDEEQQEKDVETTVFRDLETVPVKVGEPEAAKQTQEAKPVQTQIGEKLTEALQSKENRVEIQLTPENLGKVTIEVTVRQDGSLRVSLHAELSQTRDLLERDLPGLQSALARNSQQEVRVEVQRQQEERNFYDGQQGQERQNPHQQRRDRQSREGTEDFLHQLRLGLIPEEGE